VLAGLTLPLALAIGLRLGVHPAIHVIEAGPAARPSWRPFAIAFALAVAVPLAPLYLAPNVRLIGPVGASSGPLAAPEPGAASAIGRTAAVSLADLRATDRSCEAEGQVRSPYAWSTIPVLLYNDTETPVAVTWLDYDGHRDEEVVVNAHAEGPLEMYVGAGHLFVLTGSDGSCLMVFKIVGVTPLAIHLRT
jgi:hypothetical protein